jgi:endoglucanase
MKKRRIISTLIFLFVIIGCQGNTPLVIDPTGKSSLTNGDFSMGRTDWETWSNGRKCRFEFKDEAVSVIIHEKDKRPWDAGLQQRHILLEKGKHYQISFDGMSENAQQIRVDMGMNRDPYYLYTGAYYFTLTPSMKSYSVTFTMWQDSDKDCSFDFFVGNSEPGTLILDNVVLTCLGDAQPLEIPVDFPPPNQPGIKRGIQFGLQFASPYEGAYGPELKEEYYDIIKKDGRFDHIRIPVWWEYHTDNKPPYKINPDFMKRVDWAVSQSMSRGFPTILNMHWFRALENQPLKNKAQYLATWRQIAEYYQNYPDHLYFDIMNEPNRNLDQYWNSIFPEVYDIIRETNPTRPIIISGPYWAHMEHIPDLVLPDRIKNDPHVMIQFHPYVPGDFCFQGSVGNGEYFENLHDIRWLGTEKEKAEIRTLYDNMEAWSARNNNISLLNGEFSAQNNGGSLREDRLRWDRFMVEECEKRGIPWNYYDFCEEGGKVYDIQTGEWDEELMQALFGE